VSALTEAEAHEKRCPIMSDPIATVECVATGCAAWRWFDSATEITASPVRWIKDGESTDYIPGPRPPGDGWVMLNECAGDGQTIWQRPHPHRRGFCGLAGRPQP
jgi:hypothetical protein